MRCDGRDVKDTDDDDRVVSSLCERRFNGLVWSNELSICKNADTCVSVIYMLALKDTACRIETGASSSTYFVYLVAAIKSVYFETNETSGMFVVHEE